MAKVKPFLLIEVIGKVVAGSGSAPASAAAKAKQESTSSDSNENSDVLTPSVRRLIAEKGLDASKIKGSGKGGRITKEDVDNFLKSGAKSESKIRSSACSTSR